jgi:hypothetical protein
MGFATLAVPELKAEATKAREQAHLHKPAVW